MRRSPVAELAAVLVPAVVAPSGAGAVEAESGAAALAADSLAGLAAVASLAEWAAVDSPAELAADLVAELVVALSAEELEVGLLVAPGVEPAAGWVVVQEMEAR